MQRRVSLLAGEHKEKAEKLWGHLPAALFGYSHLLGGFAGGQAEHMRVPYADVGQIKVPDGLSDEQVLFLSEVFSYMAADFCNLKGGETVAILGCGPVGQFGIHSAFLLDAERVIAIDTMPERLVLAKEAGAVTLDFKTAAPTRVSMRSGRKPTPGPASMRRSNASRSQPLWDRPHVLRQAIHCCRNFGTVSIVGVYGGFVDKIPMGSAINRGLTVPHGSNTCATLFAETAGTD
jgi:threonine dehydrogenase-like Zn-dependent dehydrogenase